MGLRLLAVSSSSPPFRYLLLNARNLPGVRTLDYDVSSEFASTCQIAMAQFVCGVAFCLACHVKPYGNRCTTANSHWPSSTVISWQAVTTAVFANPQAFTKIESNGVGVGLVIFSLVTLACWHVGVGESRTKSH